MSSVTHNVNGYATGSAKKYQAITEETKVVGTLKTCIL